MFKTFDNDTLVEMYKEAANELSYFNAAEGQSWYAERDQRIVAKEQFINISKEMDIRKIEKPTGNWLI